MSNLDKKIKSWSDQFLSEDNKPNELLIQKIMGKIRYHGRKDTQPQLNSYVRRLFWTRMALATCVILLLINVFYSFQQYVSPTRIVGKDLLLKANELQEIKVAVKEFDRIFPEGIQWINKTGEQIDIHPGPSRFIGDTSRAKKILITFHIVQKNEAGKTIIRRHDIIAKEGEPIESGDGVEMALWTHQVDEDYINIEVDRLFEDKNFQIRVRNQFLQAFGKQNLIATGTSQEKSYEIYQTAYRL